MADTGLTLFISYAHEDEPCRKDFEKHLAALKREGLIAEWHDRKIMAGQDWERELHAHFDRSHIIILLISPDFMASDYCNRVEVTRAMDRYKMGTARVIPVLLRPADWQGAPFSKLQALPTDARPVSEWADQDAAYADVAGHLRDVCGELAKISGNPANPYTVAVIGDWYEAEIRIDFYEKHIRSIAKMRLTVVDKNDREATVHALILPENMEKVEKIIKVPLAQPLEDAYGAIVSGVGEQVPANASVEIRPLGAGVEKLFIGGKTYYTTWIEKEVEFSAGRDSLIQKGKLWMAPEIPLDGWVKMVMETPGEMKQTTIVTAYGRGPQAQ